MLTCFGHAVQLVRRDIVPHEVPPVVGKPEFARRRMPVEAHGIAHAAHIDFQVRSVRVHAHYRRITRIRALADVARCAHGNVQLAVGAESDELPPMMSVGRETRVDHDRFRGIFQAVFDVVVPENPADLGDVERSVAKRNPTRHPEPAVQDNHLVGGEVSVPVPNGVDVPCAAGADEEGAGQVPWPSPAHFERLGRKRRS